MTALFYYSCVETGYITLGVAMGIPLMIVGIGLYVDAEMGGADANR